MKFRKTQRRKRKRSSRHCRIRSTRRNCKQQYRKHSKSKKKRYRKMNRKTREGGAGDSNHHNVDRVLRSVGTWLNDPRGKGGVRERPGVLAPAGQPGALEKEPNRERWQRTAIRGADGKKVLAELPSLDYPAAETQDARASESPPPKAARASESTPPKSTPPKAARARGRRISSGTPRTEKRSQSAARQHRRARESNERWQGRRPSQIVQRHGRPTLASGGGGGRVCHSNKR